MAFDSTEKEIEFVKKLGSWSDRGFDRLILLKKYRKNMELRNNWGRIDKNSVGKFCDDMISRLEKMDAVRRIQQSKDK